MFKIRHCFSSLVASFLKPALPHGLTKTGWFLSSMAQFFSGKVGKTWATKQLTCIFLEKMWAREHEDSKNLINTEMKCSYLPLIKPYKVIQWILCRLLKHLFLLHSNLWGEGKVHVCPTPELNSVCHFSFFKGYRKLFRIMYGVFCFVFFSHKKTLQGKRLSLELDSPKLLIALY